MQAWVVTSWVKREDEDLATRVPSSASSQKSTSQNSAKRFQKRKRESDTEKKNGVKISTNNFKGNLPPAKYPPLFFVVTTYFLGTQNHAYRKT